MVTWNKGLTTAEAVELAAEVPMPFALHFRIATHGGTSPKLTHPFPVTKNVGLSLDGDARMVLFHNGVWNGFKNFEAKADHLEGPTSDSRIIAWIMHEVGRKYELGIAEEIASSAGRLLVFDKEGIKRYGTGWQAGTGTGGTTKGIWYSNSGCRIPTYTGHGYGASYRLGIGDTYTGRLQGQSKGRKKPATKKSKKPVGHNNVHSITATMDETPVVEVDLDPQPIQREFPISLRVGDGQPSMDQLNDAHFEELKNEPVIEPVYNCDGCSEWFPKDDLDEMYNHSGLSEVTLCEGCANLYMGGQNASE
jgi:hypothetical protein